VLIGGGDGCVLFGLNLFFIDRFSLLVVIIFLSPCSPCSPFTLHSLYTPFTLCSPFTLHPPPQARCGRNPLVLDHGTWRTPRTQSRPPCPWREGKATVQRPRISTLVLYLWTKSLDNMNIYIDNDSLFLTTIFLHG